MGMLNIAQALGAYRTRVYRVVWSVGGAHLLHLGRIVFGVDRQDLRLDRARTYVRLVV